MPITLCTDADKRHRLEVDDSWIEYTRAGGDEVREVIEENRDELGNADMRAVFDALTAKHVTGWGGFADDDGNEFEFAEDRVEVFIAALPYHLGIRLDARITSGYVESVEAGKD